MKELEAQEPQTMLVNVDELNLKDVFGEGKVEDILTFIREQVEDVLTTVPDVETDKGRREIKSAAYKVTRSKTALDDAGKKFAADLKETVRKIDGNRKLLRESLDALKDEVRGPVDKWEQAQAERDEEISRNLNRIISAGQFTGTSEEIGLKLGTLKQVEITEDAFGDKQGDAAIQKDIAVSNLERALKKAEQAEADAAELERLRQEADERARKDAIRARQEAAVEQARAQERARADKAEKEAREARERAERAEKEAEERVQAERDAAARRAAEEQRAADERAADQAHRRTVNLAAAEAITEWTDLSLDEATKIVTLIAAGQVPHVKVEY